MNNFFKNFDWSFASIMKALGILLAILITASLVISLVGMSLNTAFNGNDNYNQTRDFAESSMMDTRELTSKVSLPPDSDYSTGDDAEDFEIKEFRATVETRNLDETCAKVMNLKTDKDIIFERSDTSTTSCNYSFKVIKEREAEILAIIEGLKPENLNESSYTIQRSIEQYDSELQILEKKLISIEEALATAQSAYDELTVLATKKQDIESLAKIIDSKLNLIEKLSQERMNIKEQIDRFNKNKADQLERLKYSYFYIDIYEKLLIDWKQIQNSWKWELEQLVNTVNATIQGVTVNLVDFALRLAMAAVYFFLGLFILKGAWKLTKKIWKI